MSENCLYLNVYTPNIPGDFSFTDLNKVLVIFEGKVHYSQ